jgi:hypothetical protein
MLKQWSGWFDDLFNVQYVCYSCHLLGMSAWFLLCYTYVLADLPHLQNFVDLGHSVHCHFLPQCHLFRVVLYVRCIQFTVITSQSRSIGLSQLHHTECFANSLSCGFWLPPAENNLPKGKTALHLDTTLHDGKFVVCLFWEIGIHGVYFTELVPPVGNVQYRKCTLNHHWLGVVIIEIEITLPPAHWWFRRWIQIKPAGSQ